MEEDCVILDIPEGVRLNLLGLVVQIDRVLITADRAGLLGGLLASLTCGGAGAAEQLDALAQMVRAREIAPEEPAQDQEQAGEEEPAEDQEQAEEEPAEDEEAAQDEEPAEDEEAAQDEEPAEDEEAVEEEPAEDEEEAVEEEPAEDEEEAVEEAPAQPRSRRGRGGRGRA